MLGLDMRKRSRVFTVCPARSGTRVGSEITCVKSLIMAKASASQPAGFGQLASLLSLGECTTQGEFEHRIFEQLPCYLASLTVHLG